MIANFYPLSVCKKSSLWCIKKRTNCKTCSACIASPGIHVVATSRIDGCPESTGQFLEHMNC